MNDNMIIVRQLPVIEDQLLQVKASIESRVSEALSLACTEDTYKAVKKARSELNKEYTELERRRKEVKASILAPYEQFEKLYKECAGDIYTQADSQLKARISEVEEGLKQQRLDELLAYFEEYRQSLGLDPDLATLSASGIKVTLSDSKKALKTKAKEFLDRVAGDLELIETQELKEEILVEYRRTLNISAAVTTVNNRHKAMEAERQRREAAMAARTALGNSSAKVEEVVRETAPKPGLMPPVEAPAEDAPQVEDVSPAGQATEKLYSTAFRVTDTLDKLKALKKFLVDGGYTYEQL